MKLSKWIITTIALVCSTMVWAKININTASLSELESLKGIGEKKAEKIIEYREKVGSFKSIEDLVNVSGIGTVTLNKIRDEIVISDNNLVSSSKKTKVETKEESSPKTQKEKLDVKNEITKKTSVDTKEIKKDEKKTDKSKSSETSSPNKDKKDQSTTSK